jgi:acyl-CoA reductase-like NAD-dependent aldehyde dehydrogenase
VEHLDQRGVGELESGEARLVGDARQAERCLYVAERIEAGGVGVNVNDVTELAAPFGGWKESGFGRELGPEGLQHCLELKHIRIGLTRE